MESLLSIELVNGALNTLTMALVAYVVREQKRSSEERRRRQREENGEE